LQIKSDAAHNYLWLFETQGIVGPADEMTGMRQVLNQKTAPPPSKHSLLEQLRIAQEEIIRLRALGRRVVDDRDHWENLAKVLTQSVNEKTQKLILQDQQIDELKQRMNRMQEQLDALAKATPDTSNGGNDKFSIVKREFAKMYHPNNTQFSGIEKIVRQELFKEFWTVLIRIEGKGK
jgi:hypothetical protein